jgi:hypothetical protein
MHISRVLVLTDRPTMHPSNHMTTPWRASVVTDSFEKNVRSELLIAELIRNILPNLKVNGGMDSGSTESDLPSLIPGHAGGSSIQGKA